MRPTLLYSIIYSLVAFPLTPKHVTLNDFEWLEGPFYVICSLLRTDTDSLFVIYLLSDCRLFITRMTNTCDQRKSGGNIANSDPQSGRIFGIRGKSADLPWKLYRRNLNK